jgi:FlaA1/EpsC-like NDP-sugar epimerase
MKIRVTVVAALLSTVLSTNALACGDSLYRVGKGIAYRTYSAPLPGNLLVFGTSESAKQLAEELAKTGHGVHLVGSIDQLNTELDKGGYDIVIAPFNERESIDRPADTSFLPIAMNREEEKAAKQSYDRVMVPEKHEIKHYLKAIHKALKENA